MKNPIYLTESELITWHGHQFGVIPAVDDDDEIALSGSALRDHCCDLYRITNGPELIYED